MASGSGVFRAAGICIVLAAFTPQAALARCKRTDWNFGGGVSAVTTRWTLSMNAACHQRVGLGSKRFGYLDSLRVSQQASHGLAGVNNSITDHGFAYQPSNNFVGVDHFQVKAERHDSWNNEPEPVTIDVNIQIVDRDREH
jgi:hypothetical protein